MEMLLLEELEQCECLDGIDQYSLQQVNDSNSSVRGLLNEFNISVPEAPQPQKTINDKDSHNYVDLYSEEARAQPDERSQYQLDDWEISLYDVEFLKRIGHGAAGTTYLGKLHGQKVAVKVASISDIGVEGWRTELTSLKRIHHTNIIRFLGAIYNPSPLIYCLVLEYCNGGDLSQVLKTRTPPNFFKTVASDVASGLAYLHKKNILHRDVKPGNVLLHGEIQTGNFIAKLTDFGLAAIVQVRFKLLHNWSNSLFYFSIGRRADRITLRRREVKNCLPKQVLIGKNARYVARHLCVYQNLLVENDLIFVFC